MRLIPSWFHCDYSYRPHFFESTGETFPVNSYEAESRRLARFSNIGHTPGVIEVPGEERNPEFPLTLDLRRTP